MPTYAKTTRAIAQLKSRKHSQRKYKWLGQTLAQVEEQPWSKYDLKIRTIGRRAHDAGGMAQMRAVWWKLREEGVHVGHRWEGIGGWYA